MRHVTHKRDTATPRISPENQREIDARIEAHRKRIEQEQKAASTGRQARTQPKQLVAGG